MCFSKKNTWIFFNQFLAFRSGSLVQAGRTWAHAASPVHYLLSARARALTLSHAVRGSSASCTSPSAGTRLQQHMQAVPAGRRPHERM